MSYADPQPRSEPCQPPQPLVKQLRDFASKERWQLLALDLVHEFVADLAELNQEERVIERLLGCIKDVFPVQRVAVVMLDKSSAPVLSNTLPERDFQVVADDLEQLIESGSFGRALGQNTLVVPKVSLSLPNAQLYSLESGGEYLGLVLSHWRVSKPNLAMRKLFGIVQSLAADAISALRAKARIERQRQELERVLVKRNDELDSLLHHDVSTGLPNCRTLCEQLDAALPKKTPLALLLLDLRRFTHINSTWGFDIGDQVICLVAKRLRAVAERISSQQVRVDVARHGGDSFTFTFVGHPLQDRVVINRVIDAVNESLGQVARIADIDIVLSFQAGVAFSQGVEDKSQLLLNRAELALRESVGTGANSVVFFEDRSEGIRSATDLSMENDLGKAMREEQLCLFYQPKVSLHTGEVVGAEALLRWQHPERGWVSPAEFIPVAERSRMIHHIGLWCMEQACQALARWRDLGLNQLQLSVNVSAQQLHENDLVENILRSIERHAINPERLEVELTESVMAHRPHAMAQTIEPLRQQGVSLAIDDFGTGYSSLLQLKRFPVDTLKIDRAFVDGITNNDTSAAMVNAMVFLAQQMRMITVAEGVEQLDEVNYVRMLGCDIAQGYYISPPINEHAFLDFVRTWRGF